MGNQQEQSKGWEKRLKDLFSTTTPLEAPAPQAQSDLNPDNLKVGETFEQWGTRICGIVSGSLNALPPYLQKVYSYVYGEQVQNIELQNAARADAQAEIGRKNEELNLAKRKIDSTNSEIERFNKKIQDLKEERQEIREAKEKVNKNQRLKLIIGLVIILPMTFYLFIFYSSTFYSAFFRNPSSMTDVLNSMFDSNALSNAYAAGYTELGFVLSAPIIFLGLGFTLHFFSEQDGKMKFLKMCAILMITLIFDCILAYKIGEQIHTFGIIIGQYPIGEDYTISMAFHDINTWAVIFCGFIVYILWGIVFDMCMSAYDKLDLKKTRLESIKNEIKEIENSINSERQKIESFTQQMADIRGEITKLMTIISGHEKFIDYTIIKKEMTNFFAGWIKMMQVLSISAVEQDEASTIYQREVAQLIKE